MNVRVQSGGLSPVLPPAAAASSGAKHACCSAAASCEARSKPRRAQAAVARSLPAVAAAHLGAAGPAILKGGRKSVEACVSFSVPPPG